MSLRIDVRYVRPDGYQEVGLVDYPPGAEPKTPTLFIGAYCRTKADAEWFKRAVDDIITMSEDE